MFRPDPEPDHFAAAFDAEGHAARSEAGEYGYRFRKTGLYPNEEPLRNDQRDDRVGSSGGPPTAMGAAPPSLTECERCKFTIAIDDPECGHCGLDREHEVDEYRAKRFYRGKEWTDQKLAQMGHQIAAEALKINKIPPLPDYVTAAVESLKRMGGAVTVFGEGKTALQVKEAQAEAQPGLGLTLEDVTECIKRIKAMGVPLPTLRASDLHPDALAKLRQQTAVFYDPTANPLKHTGRATYDGITITGIPSATSRACATARIPTTAS